MTSGNFFVKPGRRKNAVQHVARLVGPIWRSPVNGFGVRRMKEVGDGTNIFNGYTDEEVWDLVQSNQMFNKRICFSDDFAVRPCPKNDAIPPLVWKLYSAALQSFVTVYSLLDSLKGDQAYADDPWNKEPDQPDDPLMLAQRENRNKFWALYENANTQTDENVLVHLAVVDRIASATTPLERDNMLSRLYSFDAKTQYDFIQETCNAAGITYVPGKNVFGPQAFENPWVAINSAIQFNLPQWALGQELEYLFKNRPDEYKAYQKASKDINEMQVFIENLHLNEKYGISDILASAGNESSKSFAARDAAARMAAETSQGVGGSVETFYIKHGYSRRISL
jgi:hypothetical protein